MAQKRRTELKNVMAMTAAEVLYLNSLGGITGSLTEGRLS